MNNIVQFPGTTKDSEPVPERHEVEVVPLNSLCIAVAYYAGIGELHTAHKLKKFINVYEIYHDHVEVTGEVVKLVAEIDIGMAVLGNFHLYKGKEHE
jgi:hypothetical protein